MNDKQNKESADTLYKDTFNKHVDQYGEDKARQIALRVVREYWTGEAELDEDPKTDF
jgi:hypothetical protein